jgi:hypothetical protein
MGLDMYLEARVGLGVDWEATRDEEPGTFVPESRLNDVMEIMGLSLEDLGDSLPSATISVNVAYWRKANAIHGWFVNKLADGRDECQELYVPRQSLTDLRDLCKELLVERNEEDALEKLPPMGGFFFGTYEIDDWYWDGLEYTRDRLTEILNNEKFAGQDFIYQASW